MKRLILAFAMAALLCVQGFAKPTQSEVRQFRNQVVSYLRSFDGYNPSVDDDGDVKFTVDGNPYWISVSALSDGYSVKLFTVGTKTGQSTNAMLRAANSTMKDYGYAQIIVLDGGYAVRMYQYCENISEFKTGFLMNLAAVSVLEEHFLEKL